MCTAISWWGQPVDWETAATALALVALVAVFVALEPIIPTNQAGFSELGILGPNMIIGGYPTSVTQGGAVHLYCYVGNHEGTVAYYQVLVKLGNSATFVSNTTSADAPEILSYSLVLADNQSSIFPVTLAMNTTGTNLRLIFELWAYNISISQFAYTGLWDQLMFNVTGGP